jgi:hypothetical protein
MWQQNTFSVASSRLQWPGWTDWHIPYVPQIAAIPIVVMAAILAGHFVVSYGQGTPPPPRVLNALYAIFIAGWFIWLIAVGRHVVGSAEKPNILIGGIGIAARFLFPLCLMFSSTMVSGILDFRHGASKWVQAIAARDQTVRQAVAREPGRRTRADQCPPVADFLGRSRQRSRQLAQRVLREVLRSQADLCDPTPSLSAAPALKGIQ